LNVPEIDAKTNFAEIDSPEFTPTEFENENSPNESESEISANLETSEISAPEIESPEIDVNLNVPEIDAKTNFAEIDSPEFTPTADFDFLNENSNENNFNETTETASTQNETPGQENFANLENLTKELSKKINSPAENNLPENKI
jgi:hypothetical protein